MIDLHTHSTASDGTLSPAELIERARQSGLTALALTDHDTVDGIAAALGACGGTGLAFFAGVELTVRFEGHGLHLLGYGVDHTDPDLRDTLHSLAARREHRARLMVESLRAMGLGITWERVRGQARGSVGRPHIGRVLVEAGYARDMNEAFARFIGSSCPAYLPSASLPVEGVVDLIEGAGGQVGWAHPYRGKYPPNVPELLPALLRAGLTGIEVYHPDHDPSMVSVLRGLAEHHGLWWSGGSDYHGPARPPGRLGAVRVPAAVLKQGPFTSPGTQHLVQRPNPSGADHLHPHGGLSVHVSDSSRRADS
ncbi:MAG TPA: PHP domain-containing protein [Chloroflexota bacterium]|nr:PHP domain-containing protein [Chloroflexota bacterium]